MERISAACAMEWSIELEKGLRSKKPGRPVEAILQIGPRVERWSKEPIPTLGVLNMFHLVPGEDRLFANTILLRLADVFKYGDKPTRASVLKIFLLEQRQYSRKGEKYNGILSKERLPNYLELLKRVKMVFDMGDVESRALTLRLLGCWANISKDSAEVRHMILSSLESCHVMEVKASLFAAGCFSELSEDFASVLLEVLANMVTSSQTSSAIKLAAAQTFAKIGVSSMLAVRAYKTGRKLVLESSQEEFIIEMLMSLSKLASKSMLLVTCQVDTLFSFITNKSAQCIQAMALRCIYHLLAGGVCRFPTTLTLVGKFFHVLDNGYLPIVSECKVLQILCKIFQATKPCLFNNEMNEFVKWVSIVINATQSPITSKRLWAFRLLVVICCKRKLGMEIIRSGNDFLCSQSDVIMLMLDQLARLVKLVPKPCESASEVAYECKSLLCLVFCMVKEYPVLGVVALTRIKSCIESILDVCKWGKGRQSVSHHEIVVSGGGKHRPLTLKTVFCMYRFVESCVEILNDVSALTDEIHLTVKSLVETMHYNCLYDQDTCTVDLLLLHSRVICSIGLGTENKEIYTSAKGFDNFDNHCWIEHETHTIAFLKKMLAERNDWDAYKAGRSAACQGSWFVATYTYGQLINRVEGDACNYWLKSLARVARAESSIMLLRFPEQGLRLAEACGEFKVFGPSVASDAEFLCHFKKLNEAYCDICSASEMLAVGSRTNQAFIFQRWFLVLRSRFLEAMVNILELLHSSQSNEENSGKIKQVGGSTNAGFIMASQHVPFLSFLNQISFRFNRLAQDFDRLATSFMDMDATSYETISSLALICSSLAFCTGFLLYSHENATYIALKNLEKCSPSSLVQDLLQRLWHIDIDMTMDLKRLSTTMSEPGRCFDVPPKAVVYKVGYKERETLDICRFAISATLRIQEEANTTNGGKLSQDFTTRLQLMSDILKRWINIPFQIPKYYFQVRPCIGVELFVSNADTSNLDGLSVFPGFYLSLNLCLQLKRAPPVTITKLHCVLVCSASNCAPGLAGESRDQYRSGLPWETSYVVGLNEKLWGHLMESAKKTGNMGRKECKDNGSVWSFACFQLNERGQGFSTCLLDVSAFPVGSYKIDWHCCCIDSKGSYWSLLPLNISPVFNVKKAT